MDHQHGGDSKPLISIITPSYRQGAYIEETIESVLNQDYPNLEHIVVDGGSDDGTVEILQHYSSTDQRFRFVSEPDRGQAHAINKGLHMARGSLIGWLNSDDIYWPGAVRKAVEALLDHPDWAVVYGRALHMNERSVVTDFYPTEPYSPKRLYEQAIICQPAAFFRKAAADQLGGMNEELYFCMDYDFWIRLSKQSIPIGYIDETLAGARLHPTCKNVVDWLDRGFPELIRVCLKHYGSVSGYWLHQYIGSHLSKGASWLIQQVKSFGISGETPQVIESNIYEDHWAPPHLRLMVRNDPDNPLHTVVIRGFHKMAELLPDCSELTLTIKVDGRTLMEDCNKDMHGFNLEIPVYSRNRVCLIEILAEPHFIPAHVGDSPDTRSLSFMISEIVPLSAEEYDVFALIHHLYGKEVCS